MPTGSLGVGPADRASTRIRRSAARPASATAIEVDAVPVGRVAFDGPGAGGAATSSAVLGDLVAVARGAGSTWGPRPRGRPARDAVARPGGDFLETATASGTRSMTESRRPRRASDRPPAARWSATARFLPVTDATPALTLGEGDTPLVHAPRLGAAIGLPNLHLKVEGQNPTGSFKDRGMVVAVAKAAEDGATGRSSARRPATRRLRPRPTARRPGWRSSSSCRRARSRSASCSRR